jgi:poly(A)-specific ribonuclease
MDIDRYSFPSRALELLETIASSNFVAIDCEFSGVSRPPNNSRGLKSLEERYQETRKAAKKYHILQVGITCASLLSAKPQEYFCLKPFNVHISPVLSEELEVDRDFTFQGGAVEFLIRNNFNFTSSLQLGVRYLSRTEEQEALAVAETKALRMTFEDIVLTERDIEALEFMERIRREVRTWKRTSKPNANALTINSRKDVPQSFNRPVDQPGAWQVPPELELTSFDRRLIHQLVRAEFPELRTMTRSGSILVTKFDPKREKEQAAGRINKAKRIIQENVGFRWIVEALFGGTKNLSNMDVKAFGYAESSRNNQQQSPNSASSTSTPPKSNSFYELMGRRVDIITKLKERPVVLVGHNIFGDLAYLYQHFIGDLPETLEGFREILRKSVPLVIDTKYMATHNCGNTQPPSSLEQLNESLRGQKEPGYGIPVGFEKYLEAENGNGRSNSLYLHEAGYDGYLTAQVLLKLTNKLGSTTLGLGSDFWQEYGNKLRVFGTHETMFDLNKRVSIPEEDAAAQGLTPSPKR